MFQLFERRLDVMSGKLPAVKLQTLVALALTANLAIAPAASPAIGVAMAGGSFELDASRISGNGTLFEGSILETGKATSEIKLNNGVRMMLDAGTRSKVYRDHMLLEKGTGQLTGGASYRISARTLEIEGGAAKVTTNGNRVLVAALTGPVVVKNAEGLTVANLASGRAVELEPRGASSQNVLTGKLEKQAGRYLLTDRNAGVTVEVRGSGLDRNAGRVVEVTGTTEKSAKAAAPATGVVYATNVRNFAKRFAEGGDQNGGSNTDQDNRDCKKDDNQGEGAGQGQGAGNENDKDKRDRCGAGAWPGGGSGGGTATGTGAGAGAGAGTGISNGVIIAVVAGGAAAATGIGLAVTGDDKKPVSQ